MIDQASELRRLVLATPREAYAGSCVPLRLLVLTGAKGGVGTTTLAVNLAVALADHGARVVLVDADVQRADVTNLCGLSDYRGVADVLASRRDIHEVLLRGPAGIQIVPGVWAPGDGSGFSEKTQYRLLRQLRGLGRHAEWVLVDVGHGSPEVVRRFWQAADEVLMVTTPDNVSVMDAYATLKSLLGETVSPCLRLLVNRSTSEDEATDVHRRLDQSCRRFLGREIRLLGQIPADEAVPAAAQQHRPLLSQDSTSTAALAVIQTAARLLSEPFSSGSQSGSGDSPATGSTSPENSRPNSEDSSQGDPKLGDPKLGGQKLGNRGQRGVA